MVLIGPRCKVSGSEIEGSRGTVMGDRQCLLRQEQPRQGKCDQTAAWPQGSVPLLPLLCCHCVISCKGKQPRSRPWGGTLC